MNYAPLGRIAESSSTREEQPLKANVSKLRDVAQKRRFELQRHAAKLLPGERMMECMVKPVPGEPYIAGSFNPTTETAYFSHLKVCDSYACPVCASRRSEKDRHELAVALAQAQKLNLFPLLCTLTMSHHMGDRLDDTRQTLADCFDAVFSGSWYQRFKTKYRIVGKIKAWEVTYGKNGWHPHLHTLFFAELEFVGKWVEDMQAEIAERWIGVLEKRGHIASWAHGCDVRTADSDIADYIAKFGHEPIEKTWGVDAEIGRIAAKQAGKDGLTPIEILAASAGDTEALEHLRAAQKHDAYVGMRQTAGDLYREYFYAFKHRARLYWSIGLKDLLLLEAALIAVEENEKENSPEPIQVFLVKVGEDWKKVCGSWNTPDLRGELLEVLRCGDVKLVVQWFRRKKIPAILFD